MPSLRPFRLALVLLPVLMLTSCASYFVRKQCESTDWFQYGRQIAMKGERLTGNAFIRQCEEAEANVNAVALDRGFKSGMATYCLPDTVYQLGKRGEFFQTEMCDGEQPRLLKRKHEEGVAEFCQKSNGYSIGAAGTAYNGICPKALEPEFLLEFKRGRKAHLATLVELNEKEIAELERDLPPLESRLANLEGQLSALSLVSATRDRSETVRLAVGTASVPADAKAPVDPLEERRRSLKRQIDQLRGEINGKKNKRESLKNKNRAFQTEMVGL